MLRTTALAALLLTTALAIPAFAADVLQPEGWQTGVMRKPDGTFAYCVSESKFNEGLWLVLALNPTKDVNLGVGQHGANLPVGQDKQVHVAVNGMPPMELSAKAVKPELMVINAGQSDAFLNALSKGSQLTIDAMVFSLKGSGEAVATLRECVDTSMKQGVVPPTADAATAPAPDMAMAAATPGPVAPAAPAPVAPAPAAAAPDNGIRWNDAPVAVPGERDSVGLPPSMQAPLPVPTALASAPAAVTPAPAPTAPVEAPASKLVEQTMVEPTAAKPAAAAPAPVKPEATPAPVAAAPAPAENTETDTAMAPELTPPAPDHNIVTFAAGTTPPTAATATPPVPAPEVAEATPAPVASASSPASAVVAPNTKPLPAPLESLLTKANLRDLEPAPITSSDVAYAWKSRDMLGTVRELSVPATSNIVQLAGQHFSALKAQCGADFAANLNQPETTGTLQVLTGSAVCRGNGASVYTTLVFALSQQGVLSIVSHQIDGGRRAAPDRAQSGLVAALKNTQG